jgi:ABC-type phosphate transport system substrate-binding protein
VYKNQPEKVKGEAIKSFLRYMVGDAQMLAEDVDYAPLPAALQQKAVAQIDQILVLAT